MQNTTATRALKKTLIKSSSNPEKLCYLNTSNGCIYNLSPDEIEGSDIDIIDATKDITSLDELHKESLKIMDEYIKSSCFYQYDSI